MIHRQRININIESGEASPPQQAIIRITPYLIAPSPEVAEAICMDLNRIVHYLNDARALAQLCAVPPTSHTLVEIMRLANGLLTDAPDPLGLDSIHPHEEK